MAPPLSKSANRATLVMRATRKSIDAISAVAAQEGLTMKQVVFRALREAGVPVEESDLDDRTPRRKAP